jgi:hypothetical protein
MNRPSWMNIEAAFEFLLEELEADTDINAFVLALSGQALYEERYPNYRYMNADANPFAGLISRAGTHP